MHSTGPFTADRWRQWILRSPTWLLVACVMLCSVVLSVLSLIGVFLYLDFGFGPDFPLYMGIAVVIPIVVSGPVSWFIVRLVGEVDAARKVALQMSWRDELTGLYNRRRFGELVQRDLDLARRVNGGLAVALIDLDHFKAINDRHGHAAGDTVLREVAAATARTLRGTDLAARWGGEEFAIVMPGTDASTAQSVADRLLDAIRAMRVPCARTGSLLSCTASIGIAVAPDAGVEFESLVHAADQAMYRAKADGRNRIVLAGATGGPKVSTSAAASPQPAEG